MAGAIVVGVDGLVARIELELGIAPPQPWSARVLGLLRAEDLFGSYDPVGEATQALRLADSLRAELVELAMLPSRWRAPLSDAMRCSGSLSDRVDRIIARLPRAPHSWSIVVHAMPARWPGVIQRLLSAIEGRGAIVSWVPEPPALAPPPRVVLVRGPNAAIVAARAVDGVVRRARSDAVWIAPDAIVDHALAARGLPLCGGESRRHPAEGLLGRVVALAFRPQHPLDALDLLTAPCCPLERSLARRLCDALQEWPSWHSAEWADACRAACDAAGNVPPSLAWLLSCLEPLAARDEALAVEPLRRRVDQLGGLARTLSSALGEDVGDLCARFSATLSAWGAPTMERPLIDGFVALAEADLPPSLLGAPQVGTLALPALSSLIGAVDQLVVWDAASPPSDPFAALLPTERAGLRAAGATVPDASTLRSYWHADLRRAIALTRESAWLCLPDTDARGVTLDPPSWGGDLDLWLRESAGAACEAFDAPRRSVTRRGVPRARSEWQVASRLIPPRHRESPSSMMTALGCSLRHALRYNARLGEPHAPTLPDGGLLYGRLAHALFEHVWSGVGDATDPKLIATRLGERFDAELPRLALSLTVPETRARSAAVRETIVRAGEALARALSVDDAKVSGCEVALGENRRLGGIRWNGRADIVLGPTPMVLDLKWSGALHRAALAQGTAVQLALYAWMLRGRDDTALDPPWPAVGYLIATTATLLSTPEGPLRSAEAVRGPHLSETVTAVARRLSALHEERARGELHASGVTSNEPRSGLREGEITLEPPCRGCAYGALCGRGLSP